MRCVLSCTLLACVSGIAFAHDPSETPGSSAPGGKLALILPNLFGTAGLVLPNQDHLAHFDSAFRGSFGPFNTSLASQLTSLPIPSPASGFTYTFDKSLGTSTRSAQSFGPILTERAETIGREKMYFGFAQQYFRFDAIDGVSLNRVPVVFNHGPSALTQFAQDIITTDNSLDLKITQFTSYFTYGLTDRLDISVAAPLMSASLAANSRATIRRVGTGADQSIHFFDTPDKTQAQFNGSGTASGIGDLILRVKGTAYRGRLMSVAAGLDLRAPTGDEYNFLGSGAAGVKPFVAASFKTGKVSPHVNAAYQWNGNSVLGGNAATGEKGKLPNEFAYAVGADIGATKRFTLAADVLGLHRPNAPRVGSSAFTASNGAAYPNIAFRRAGLTQHNGSFGFKVNGVGNLLFAFNLFFKLDNNGLRGRPIPLVSVSYTL